MVRQLVLGLLLLLWALPAGAQVPDTTIAPDVVPDTTVVPSPDTTITAQAPAPAPPDSVVGFVRDHRGLPVRDAQPERSVALHPSEWLADVPLAFTHSFRTPGWPDGWSPYGFAPDAVIALREGYEHVNLMTGRSALETLPFGLLDPPRIEAGGAGGAIAMITNMRTFDQARPLTGLRYQSDNIGLQHVEAFHSQRRLATIFGRRGELNLAGAYLGRGASGEYPGSQLRRERGIYGRIRFARPSWSLQISNLYGRHEIGAHGGVVPWTGGTYETIYARTDAVVRNNGARRITIRNDLDLTLRTLVAARPLDATAYRTSESFRYRYQDERAPVRAHRYGGIIRHMVAAGAHTIALRGEGWFETVEDDSAFTTRRDHERYAATFEARDSFAIAGLHVLAEAGFRTTESGSNPVGLVRISRGATIAGYVEGSLSQIDVPRMAVQGFGTYVMPIDRPRPGQALLARAGVGFAFGAMRFDVSGYAASERHRLMAVAADDDDVLRFVQRDEAIDRAGAAVQLGIRRDANRGIYADILANYIAWVSEPMLPGIAPLSDTQPEVWGTAKLGARMLLFQGDLDADLYVRGHAWAGMRGRTLHAPTGLLVHPVAYARWFSPSGYLDVVLEGQVRVATIFVAFENVLSGTEITLGNLIVSDYPLPERRFRIGVYWPIQD